MRQKYKLLVNAFAGFVLVFSAFVVFTLNAPRVHADPLPSCSGGSTLVPASGNTPAYCSCPAGQVLVTGNPNTCAASCPNGTTPTSDGKTCNGQASADGADPDKITDSTDPAATSNKCVKVTNCDLVKDYINPFVNLLAALVGIAVTISIVIGAIQYGSSAGDPQAVTAAKNRIRNSIIALLTFLFLYALLNFLIPGGLL